MNRKVRKIVWRVAKHFKKRSYDRVGVSSLSKVKALALMLELALALALALLVGGGFVTPRFGFSELAT